MSSSVPGCVQMSVRAHGIKASCLTAQVEKRSHREGTGLPGILGGVSGILGTGTCICVAVSGCITSGRC